MAKTFTQIVEELTSDINANFAPQLIDTRVGTVMKEAVINPEATQFQEAFDDIDTIQLNQSIANAASIETQALDDIAENFGITRFTGGPAVGFVRMVKFVSPTTTITIPAGTRVATLPTNSVGQRIYRTLSAAQLTGASPSDPVTGADASVDVFVQADDIGTGSNADASTVTALLDPIAGVDQIFNPSALTSGKEIQDNTELASVISSRAQGRLGTRTGYTAFVVENFPVTDVNVIGPNDTGAVRSQFGGATDIVIQGEDLIQRVESFVYTGQTLLAPSLLPLTSAVSLTGINPSDVPVVFVGPPTGIGSGTDFDVILDTTGPFAGSVLESPRIVLHFVTDTPKIGSLITLTYNNNQLVRTIQSFIDLEDNNVLGSNVLIKGGIKILVNITADITVIPGFDPADTITEVEVAVSTLFSALSLGTNVQASDVTTVIGVVAGVDSVDLVTFLMALPSAPAVNLPEVVAKEQEFIAVSTITITEV